MGPWMGGARLSWRPFARACTQSPLCFKEGTSLRRGGQQQRAHSRGAGRLALCACGSAREGASKRADHFVGRDSAQPTLTSDSPPAHNPHWHSSRPRTTAVIRLPSIVQDGQPHPAKHAAQGARPRPLRPDPAVSGCVCACGMRVRSFGSWLLPPPGAAIARPPDPPQQKCSSLRTGLGQCPDPTFHHHSPPPRLRHHREKARQLRSLELIASENFTSAAVMECLGSVLTNKVRRGPG